MSLDKYCRSSRRSYSIDWSSTYWTREHNHCLQSVDPEIQSIIADVTQNTPVSSDEVREETLRDSILQKFGNFHLERWPTKINSTQLQQFYQRRLSLNHRRLPIVYRAWHNPKEAITWTVAHRTSWNKPHESTSTKSQQTDHCTKIKAHLPEKPDVKLIFRRRRPAQHDALETFDQESYRFRLGVVTQS